MLDEIEISSPQPFDPGQALSKQAQGRLNKTFLEKPKVRFLTSNYDNLNFKKE